MNNREDKCMYKNWKSKQQPTITLFATIVDKQRIRSEGNNDMWMIRSNHDNNREEYNK